MYLFVYRRERDENEERRRGSFVRHNSENTNKKVGFSHILIRKKVIFEFKSQDGSPEEYDHPLDAFLQEGNGREKGAGRGGGDEGPRDDEIRGRWNNRVRFIF